MKNRLLFVLLAVLSIVFVQTSVWAEENAAAYLEEYYGVKFEGDVSAVGFNAALEALGAEPVETENLTMADAAVGAVRLANMEKMALSYGKASKEFLEDEGIFVEEDLAPYIACALLQNLVNEDTDFSAPVSADAAAVMLYRAAELAGKARHFVGRISDDDILPTLLSALQAISIFDHETLTNIGIDILISEATTGYSLKYSGFDARFMEEKTLRYGHDNMTHLLQLVGLMKAAGYDAYVQVEPKVSVYEYLPEWGIPAAPTPTYMVEELTEGRYFAFSLEFELALEFDKTEEKESFHDLIETYAKKYDDSFDADGNLVEALLEESWWQPLYYSTVEMENEEFLPLVDNVIPDETGYYSIHSISLPEDVDTIARSAANIDPDIKVIKRTVYVNPAFYRYITGSDHQ